MIRTVVFCFKEVEHLRFRCCCCGVWALPGGGGLKNDEKGARLRRHGHLCSSTIDINQSALRSLFARLGEKAGEGGCEFFLNEF